MKYSGSSPEPLITLGKFTLANFKWPSASKAGNIKYFSDQINCFAKRLKLSFVALDSANTLSPVPRLLKLTLALFYACSTLTKSSSKDLQIFNLLIALTWVCLSSRSICSWFLDFPARTLLELWKVTTWLTLLYYRFFFSDSNLLRQLPEVSFDLLSSSWLSAW